MEGLKPAPTTLKGHPNVSHTHATSHLGRTRNEVTCPVCSEIIPRVHAYMFDCPCGTTSATFGNSLYYWPTVLGIKGPDTSQHKVPRVRQNPPVADAAYRSLGGSPEMVLEPLTERAYQALLEADVGMKAGGADWTGAYPILRLKVPTPANTIDDSAIRLRYQTIVNALAGMKLTPEERETTYKIGNPEAIWP